MSRERIEILYKKAIKCARIEGHGSIAEDFAGWISLKWLEGKAQHQTLSQSLIDFLRAEYGGVGSRRGADALLRAHRQPQTEIPGRDESSAEETLERLHAGSVYTQRDHSADAGVEGLYFDPRNYLSLRLGEIYQAHIKEERSLAETGKDLGISESRASQLMSTVKLEILRFEGLRKMRELVDEGRTAVLVDWITL